MLPRKFPRERAAALAEIGERMRRLRQLRRVLAETRPRDGLAAGLSGATKRINIVGALDETVH